MEWKVKEEFEMPALEISGKLLHYLSSKTDADAVKELSQAVYHFIQSNKDRIHTATSLKISLFIFRLNESIEFLIATRRHHTPWGLRMVMLLLIYAFVMMYPASIIYQIGSSVSFSYILFQTVPKGFFLITFYNVGALLEDPFNQMGKDGIRVDDFSFSPGTRIGEEVPW